ncbi:unnamed protein product, partial [Mesorhabditis spiculigera]
MSDARTAVYGPPVPSPNGQRTAQIDTADFIRFVLITVLVILVRILEGLLKLIVRACDFIIEIWPKLWRAIMFCWEKPDVAKDLIKTSWHLAEISYKNGLWSFSEAIGGFVGTAADNMLKADKSSKSPKTAKPLKTPAAPSPKPTPN